MARKVPVSTIALPPTSSSSLRCWGRIAYFTGPKKVDWVPIRNSTKIKNSPDPRTKPMLATTMIPISASLTRRINVAFSNLSASWPAVAENRKNGRMNRPAARLTRVSGLAPDWLESPYVTSTTSAFLNRLSFSAPRNWVTKKGPNRFSVRSANWLMVRPPPRLAWIVHQEPGAAARRRLRHPGACPRWLVSPPLRLSAPAQGWRTGPRHRSPRRSDLAPLPRAGKVRARRICRRARPPRSTA